MRHTGARANLVTAFSIAAMLALSGCTQEPVESPAVSAMTVQGIAEVHARAQWSADAEVALILGLEGAPVSEAFESPWKPESGISDVHYGRAANDTRTGDGLCEVWFFDLTSESRPTESFLVIIDKSGEILDTGVVDRVEDFLAVGAYEVDSDTALGIARNANAGLRASFDSLSFGFVLALIRPDSDDELTLKGHPFWFVANARADVDPGEGDFVAVDAVEGVVVFNSEDF